MFFGQREETVYAAYKSRDNGHFFMRLEVDDQDAEELEKLEMRFLIEKREKDELMKIQSDLVDYK